MSRRSKDTVSVLLKNVPRPVHAKFKASCALKGESMTGAIVRFMGRRADRLETRERQEATR